MSVLVSYPNDWIEVSEFGLGAVFATLRLVGSDLPERGAQSCYVYLETLNGPVHIVDVRLVPRGEVGTRQLRMSQTQSTL